MGRESLFRPRRVTLLRNAARGARIAPSEDKLVELGRSEAPIRSMGMQRKRRRGKRSRQGEAGRPQWLPSLVVILWGLALCLGLGSLGRIWSEAMEAEAISPQEALGPLPYDEEEIVLSSQGLRLAGTLTWPRGDGPFPAVVLISGAGAQDRDGTMFGHRRYWVLADHLTQAGIAVLRLDDRGVGGSQGDSATATLQDLAADALASLRVLRSKSDLDPRRLGLIGASQGAMVASLAAEADPSLGFLILVSAPGLPGLELMVNQQVGFARASGADSDELARIAELTQEIATLALSGPEGPSLRHRLRELTLELIALQPGGRGLSLEPEEIQAGRLVDLLLSPVMISSLRHEPTPILDSFTKPVLLLYGGKDQQVDPELNLPPLRAALAGGEATTVVLPGLNHYLQPATTGSPDEYREIEIAIDPTALAAMSRWILGLGVAEAVPAKSVPAKSVPEERP